MFLWNFLLILILVALNGFFVSVEFAAVASRRSRIEILAEEGNPSAKIVWSWLENPMSRDRLIAASQLGITIVSLALGAVGENTFEHLLAPLFRVENLPESMQKLSSLLGALPLIFSLIIITSLHVVLGEQVPKVATLHNPEEIALLSAQPMRIFSTIFKWFIDILDWATRQILRIFGLRVVGGHSLIYSVEEIKQIITESEEGGIIEQPEREMLDAIFEFGDLSVRQVMIPRMEIIGIDANANLDEITTIVRQTTYTKLPVFEEDLDQILGILHVKDLLPITESPDRQSITARTLVREPIFVPETLPVSALLRRFRDNRQHIAIVLDEFGGTAGLVTLEDLLEEIVGEVSDPFDTLTSEIEALPDGSALIDGLTLIDDVNLHLNVKLHDPHYDTIAGYFLGKIGRIPEAGDMIESDGVRLRIESMDALRIDVIHLTRLEEGNPNHQSSS
jgi:CBS domain containing-hemolysin-like protein